jgi:hypothetical protein
MLQTFVTDSVLYQCFVYFLCFCLNKLLFLDLLKMSLTNNDTRSQNKQIVYKVYTFLKQLSTQPNLIANFFKNTQIRTAEACGLSERTVRRICSEAKEKTEESTSVMLFKSPRKGYKHAKIVSEIDDFDSDVVRRTVHEFYDRGEYCTIDTKCFKTKNQLFRMLTLLAIFIEEFEIFL